MTIKKYGIHLFFMHIAVFKNVDTIHFIYHINGLTTTKVDTTNLG